MYIHDSLMHRELLQINTPNDTEYLHDNHLAFSEYINFIKTNEANVVSLSNML